MRKNFILSAAIIFTFLLAVYGKDLFLKFYPIQFELTGIKLLWIYGWWIIPVITVTGIIFGFKEIHIELGLNNGFFTGLIFAGLCVFPMFISSALFGSVNNEISLVELTNKTLFSGFFEELLFRGFLFGLLFRKLKWGFIPASVLGALVFGLGHMYQGSSVSESVGVFTVTFLGALWFAWLYIEWKSNLWVPIFLHIFMNLSWILFDVGGNALGNVLSNVFRIVTIALTIIITVYYNKKKDKFQITDKNLFVNRLYNTN